MVEIVRKNKRKCKRMTSKHGEITMNRERKKKGNRKVKMEMKKSKRRKNDTLEPNKKLKRKRK